MFIYYIKYKSEFTIRKIIINFMHIKYQFLFSEESAKKTCYYPIKIMTMYIVIFLIF